MDLITALLVIVVILLVFQMSKKHNLSVITEDGNVERVLLGLAGGYAAWMLLCMMKNQQQIQGADEDNVLEPSNLSLEEY